MDGGTEALETRPTESHSGLKFYLQNLDIDGESEGQDWRVGPYWLVCK